VNNPYKPYPVRIDKIIVEAEDKSLKSFRLVFLDPEDEKAFDYLPGQFAELSLAGYGEIPIGIASSPTEKGHLLFTVNKVGSVSSALHNMREGAIMGVRGPLGNTYMLANREKFGHITFVYGARTPGMLLYKDELKAWGERDDLDTYICIDREHPDWDGIVGLGPNVLADAAPSSENAISLVCGPPIMIKFTQPVLEDLGFGDDDVILSLENRMKCGIGICGRCNVGPEYVCKDGPVFTKAHLSTLPREY